MESVYAHVQASVSSDPCWPQASLKDIRSWALAGGDVIGLTVVVEERGLDTYFDFFVNRDELYIGPWSELEEAFDDSTMPDADQVLFSDDSSDDASQVEDHDCMTESSLSANSMCANTTPKRMPKHYWTIFHALTDVVDLL